MSTPLVLTWVKPGDVVDIANDVAQRIDATMVLSPCDAQTKGFHCVTCQKHTVNLGNLLMHLEPGGAHHLVVWCQTDRRYEAPSAEQVAAFRQIIAGHQAGNQ